MDYEIGREAQYRFETPGGKRKIVVIDGRISRPNQSRTRPRIPAAFAAPLSSYRLRKTLRRNESMWARIAFSAASTSRWLIAWKIR
jgi:hypothetical protein